MEQWQDRAKPDERPERTAAAELVPLTASIGPAPSQQGTPVERMVALPDRHPEATQAILRSSFRLGAVMSADPDTNQVTSPLSALYALSLLRAGAGTTTAAELDAVLGLPTRHRDEAMNALLAAVQVFDGDPGLVDEDNPPEDPLLHLATAVFVPQEGGVGEVFLGSLARHHGAGVYPVDFADPGTPARIDAWISAETGGRIGKAPVEVGADTTLTLLTTVYFAGAWADPFSASGTSDEPFTFPDGSTAAVAMMHGDRRVRYAEGEGWTGIDLPYGGGFFLRLLLPAKGMAPAWTGEALLGMAVLLDEADEVRVGVALPTWDHAFDLDLLGPFRALGLEESLGAAADFSAIQPGTSIGGAAQSANITVAEKGTIAAAVTQLAMAASAPMPPEVTVTFDRPFGYQIVHQDTGLPVFMGTVADPR